MSKWFLVTGRMVLHSLLGFLVLFYLWCLGAAVSSTSCGDSLVLLFFYFWQLGAVVFSTSCGDSFILLFFYFLRLGAAVSSTSCGDSLVSSSMVPLAVFGRCVVGCWGTSSSLSSCSCWRRARLGCDFELWLEFVWNCLSIPVRASNEELWHLFLSWNLLCFRFPIPVSQWTL